MTRRVFISYRRDDTAAVAGRIGDRLRERLGSRSVFLDVETIEGGAEFARRILGAIESFDSMIVLVGKSWAGPIQNDGRTRINSDGDYVRMEVRSGLARGDGFTVVPVLVDGAARIPAVSLPDDLRPLLSRNDLPLRHESFDDDFERIFRATQGLAPRSTTTRARIIASAFIGLGVGAVCGLVLAIVHNAIFHQPVAATLGSDAATDIMIVAFPLLGGVAGLLFRRRAAAAP